MTWHLFYIEAQCNPDPCDSTVKGWIVSAESDSQGKAEELARQCVDEALEPEEWSDGQVTSVTCCTYLGVIDRDVFKAIGEVA